MNKKAQNESIIVNESLKSYFYNSLSDINKKTSNPVPEETLYYASEVLESYMLSGDYFDSCNGRVQEKILGTKLLKASKLNPKAKKREYKDIGDSALVMTGYFHKSIDSKILGLNYYVKIGRSAYEKMNMLSPMCFDIPSFYKTMSSCFENIIRIMHVLNSQMSFNSTNNYQLGEFFSTELSSNAKVS